MLCIIAAFAFAYLSRDGKPDGKGERNPSLSLEAAVEAKATDDTVYVCPMMCVPSAKKPGRCPVCGMQLVPASGEVEPYNEHDEEPPRLKLSRDAIRLAQIRTAPVERKFVAADVRLFGQIDYDPAHMSYVTAFMPGVIDRVYVKRAGQFVRWGDPLFSIYSPDLYATQQQLVEAIKKTPGQLAYRKGRPYIARDTLVEDRDTSEDLAQDSPQTKEALELIAGIRYKLSILGLPKRDIDELMKTGEPTGIATVYASMYGIVVEHNAYEGMYVNTGTRLIAVGDPAYVWAKLDAYESDYPWVRREQEVSIQTDTYPGEIFKGKVVYIDSILFDTKTRTFDVGVIVPDQGGRLKAGMIVRATIHAKLSADGRVVTERTKEHDAPLVIPASAPLITGKRAVVYVAVPDQEGVFEGREVTLGPRAKDHYVVRDGLKEGELVVVNGNFKVDSAIQILAKSSMMSLEGGTPALEHHHHGGSQAMHEDYSSERMESRLQSSLERESSDQSTPGVIEDRDARSRRQTRGSSLIRRRKPGTYGDTTRPKPLRQVR